MIMNKIKNFKSKHRYIFAFIVVFTLWLFITLMAVVFSNYDSVFNNLFSKESKINYEEKYRSSSNDSWVEFYKYGTCVRKVDGFDSCKYKIKGKEIIAEEENNLLGLKVHIDIHYEIIDKENIKMMSMCFHDYINPDSIYCQNEKEINLSFSLNNNYDNDKNDIENTETKSEVEEYQFGFYDLYTNGSRYASIRFSENGVCYTDFSSFNDSTNPSGVMRYTTKYINNSCTYEKTMDRKLKIYDNTIIVRTATSGGKTMNMGNSRVATEPIEVEFDENYEKLEIINGSFIYSGSPAFLTFEVGKNVSKNNEENADNSFINEPGNVSNNVDNDKYNDIDNNTSNDTNNNTKYKYRYRDKKQVISYGNWSEWQEQKIEKNDSIEVETRVVDKQKTKTIYIYYHYVCPTPTQLAPQGNATPYSTECADEYYETIESDYEYKKKGGSGSCNYSYGGYYDYKKYNGPYKKENCWFSSDSREEKGNTVSVTEYRYRDKYLSHEWGDWSGWSTKKVDSTDNRQVEERIVN